MIEQGRVASGDAVEIGPHRGELAFFCDELTSLASTLLLRTRVRLYAFWYTYPSVLTPRQRVIDLADKDSRSRPFKCLSRRLGAVPPLLAVTAAPFRYVTTHSSCPWILDRSFSLEQH